MALHNVRYETEAATFLFIVFVQNLFLLAQLCKIALTLCLENRKKKAAIYVNNVGETQALKVQNCS